MALRLFCDLFINPATLRPLNTLHIKQNAATLSITAFYNFKKVTELEFELILIPS